MPRHRRVVLPGYAHHFTQRGNNRRGVFFSDEDRRVYLTLLAEYSAKYELGRSGEIWDSDHDSGNLRVNVWNIHLEPTRKCVALGEHRKLDRNVSSANSVEDESKEAPE